MPQPLQYLYAFFFFFFLFFFSLGQDPPLLCLWLDRFRHECLWLVRFTHDSDIEGINFTNTCTASKIDLQTPYLDMSLESEILFLTEEPTTRRTSKLLKKKIRCQNEMKLKKKHNSSDVYRWYVSPLPSIWTPIYACPIYFAPCSSQFSFYHWLLNVAER